MSSRAVSVHRIFVLAAECRGAERAACLEAQCGGDVALRAEVEALLAQDESSAYLGETGLAAIRATLGEEAVPERIGAFRILGELGRGGMGVVYRARQERPAREVALKVLAPGAGSAEARQRFALEAEALGRLQHPGIAQVFEAGSYATESGPRPYLAMELVKGVSLHAWREQEDPPLARRVALWAELCDAVHHAHQKGLIHRDLKPSNVLVDEAGHVKVLDFGIARFLDADRASSLATQTGQILGTLAYMSPEQANGGTEDVDVCSDVYSLGAIGYELLAGEPPLALRGEPVTKALRRIVEEEPRPLGERDRRLRGDLQTIVSKALRKEPAERYASARELGADLRRVLAHEPIEARPATAFYLARRFARRHRGLVAGAILAVLALCTGAALSVAWALRAEEAEREAREEARIASRVTEILRAFFLGANPDVMGTRNPTAKEILAAGAGVLELESERDPFASARVALILGEVHVAFGDAARGVEHVQRALEALRREIAGDDPRLAEALHVNAWALMRAQRFAEAGPLYAEALAMHRRLGATSPALVAKCLEGLAVTAARAKDFESARRHLAEARPFREASGDALRLAAHWHNLANAEQMAGELEAAEAAYARASEILPLQGNEAFAALIAGNRGNLRLRQQRLEEAEVEFRKALAFSEAVFGTESPRLVTALTHVGTICAQTERVEEAEALLRRAIAVGGDAAQTTDVSLANALSNLGLLAAQQGRIEEAVGWWERAEAVDARLRPGAPGHLVVLQNLAGALGELGEEERARKLRERAEALRAGGAK
ncbi:MAG: serine/threonine protein kinase [Planctomycetes bacterium]|nr:serine/threonine protein kinase [Planctomycetota bacterium]